MVVVLMAMGHLVVAMTAMPGVSTMEVTGSRRRPWPRAACRRRVGASRGRGARRDTWQVLV